jgi:energy-coupling factor transporter ATP-binding protein EcfA2
LDLIKFKNFSFKYDNEAQEFLLKDINLNIESGKFILLCGVTGSGKTTLVRAMNGLIPQFYHGEMKGDVYVKGKNTKNVPTSMLSRDVGLVFQNPENQLIAMNVEREIAFGPENLGVPWEEIDSRIQDCIKITNIEHLRKKAPFELSGGEQQRVAIASVLALQPSILIFDEPTSLLDPLGAIQILQLLKEILSKKVILTIIVIEQRLDLVLPLSDEIILIDKGMIIEQGKTHTIVNGENFLKLGINIPKFVSVFQELKNKTKFPHKLPISLEETENLINSFK